MEILAIILGIVVAGIVIVAIAGLIGATLLWWGMAGTCTSCGRSLVRKHAAWCDWHKDRN